MSIEYRGEHGEPGERRVRVLVVEDEPSVATGVRRGLSNAGYLVDVATDGEWGLELATARHYDVIVLDVMLPKVNGYEVCRRLREAGNQAAILMLTAKAGEWDVAEGLDLGADDYLTKPFSMVVLLARVRARTRGSGRGGSVFTNGDLRLDPVLRRCWRGDVEVELTGREAKLLAALFQRIDEVVTKADLLESVWGERFIGSPNVVEVYVGRLRRKLEVPFGAEEIETIRGVGYRLRSPTGPGHPT
jgi:DNA-binding response OmpR family regulator